MKIQKMIDAVSMIQKELQIKMDKCEDEDPEWDNLSCSFSACQDLIQYLEDCDPND